MNVEHIRANERKEVETLKTMKKTQVTHEQIKGIA